MTKQATAKTEETIDQKSPPTDVVKIETQVPVGMSLEDLAADAGSGSENVNADNMAIPIISILQANSPQCKRSDVGKYVEGAIEGDFYNNVTNEVIKGTEGVIVVPCFYEKVYIEWKPNRGGFVAAHPESTPLKDQIVMVKNAEGKDVPTLPNGNNLIETDQHYVLLLRNGGAEPAVIAMASSALRSSRVWNTLVNNVLVDGPNGKFSPARFYKTYKLTTKARTKDSYSWFTWGIDYDATNSVFYKAAKALFTSVKAGAVKVKQEQQEDTAPAAAAAATSTKLDDEIVF